MNRSALPITVPFATALVNPWRREAYQLVDARDPSNSIDLDDLRAFWWHAEDLWRRLNIPEWDPDDFNKAMGFPVVRTIKEGDIERATRGSTEDYIAALERHGEYEEAEKVRNEDPASLRGYWARWL